MGPGYWAIGSENDISSCAFHFPFDSFSFYPQLKRHLIIRQVSTPGGVLYKSYTGTETIFFKGKTIQGSMIRYNDTLKKITCTFTTEEELKCLLCAIGIYLRYGWDLSQARDKKALKANTVALISRNPHGFVRGNATDWVCLAKRGQGSCGVLDISGSAAFVKPAPVKFKYTRGLLQAVDNKHMILEPYTDIVKSEWPSNVDVPLIPQFIKFHNYKKALVDTVYWLKINWDKTRTWIQKKSFCNYNSHILGFLETKDKDRVAHTARKVLEMYCKDTISPAVVPFLCLCYAFAGSDKAPSVVRQALPMVAFKYGEASIDLTLKSGNAIIHPETKNLTVFGCSISRQLLPPEIARLTLQTLYQNFIFSEYTRREQENPIRTLPCLKANAHLLSEGECFKVVIGGNWMVATKASTEQERIERGVHRHTKDLKRK
ncbi:hypothetical protein ONE63_004546 [Megalurothrips usitatus]|uniref:Uncharacterized protein n=1 Tax=Megalurothrips usitatus TaxID=439358 RepID=A0AAV7X355_9NEOP|nr:hypothetical protein ONE63_004546 [Megalurothrips usitatus]